MRRKHEIILLEPIYDCFGGQDWWGGGVVQGQGPNLSRTLSCDSRMIYEGSADGKSQHPNAHCLDLGQATSPPWASVSPLSRQGVGLAGLP